MLTVRNCDYSRFAEKFRCGVKFSIAIGVKVPSLSEVTEFNYRAAASGKSDGMRLLRSSEAWKTTRPSSSRRVGKRYSGETAPTKDGQQRLRPADFPDKRNLPGREHFVAGSATLSGGGDSALDVQLS